MGRGWKLPLLFLYLGIEKKKVMKDVKKIIKKLEGVRDLLEENLGVSNMDVEFMMQRVEDMIEEFDGVDEFKFEEEEED